MAFLMGFKDGSKFSQYEKGIRLPRLKALIAYEFLFSVPLAQLFLGISEGVEKEVKEKAKVLLEKIKEGNPDELGKSRKITFLNRVIGFQDLDEPKNDRGQYGGMVNLVRWRRR